MQKDMYAVYVRAGIEEINYPFAGITLTFGITENDEVEEETLAIRDRTGKICAQLSCSALLSYLARWGERLGSNVVKVEEREDDDYFIFVVRKN